MGIGVIVLSEPWGREDALGVGDTPGEFGWFPTLSFDVRFGESRAGKLSVFVHCDRLRTILTVHKHNTRSLNPDVGGRAERTLATAVRGRMGRSSGRGGSASKPVQVATWLDAGCGATRGLADAGPATYWFWVRFSFVYNRITDLTTSQEVWRALLQPLTVQNIYIPFVQLPILLY